MGNELSLAHIHQEIRGCVKCPLNLTRMNTVPGEGPHEARIMMIGEAPGEREDATGAPFANRRGAGGVLDDCLEQAGIKREDVFITNVLKCRPPNNDNPTMEQIAACQDYMWGQIHVIRPELIFTLGKYSTGMFMKFTSMTDLHGKVNRHVFLKDTADKFTAFIIPVFHPAVVKRPGGITMRHLIIEDLIKGKEILFGN